MPLAKIEKTMYPQNRFICEIFTTTDIFNFLYTCIHPHNVIIDPIQSKSLIYTYNKIKRKIFWQICNVWLPFLTFFPSFDVWSWRWSEVALEWCPWGMSLKERPATSITHDYPQYCSRSCNLIRITTDIIPLHLHNHRGHLGHWFSIHTSALSTGPLILSKVREVFTK